MRILPLIAALLLSGSVAVAAEAKGVANINFNDEVSAGLGDYLSARFAADNHDLSEAARLYMSSLDHDPGNAQLLTYAFFYAASAGRMEDATKLAQRLVAITPDERAARLTLAVAALKQRDYKKARVEIAKSAKGPFTSFTVALIDGWAAAGAGDGAAARADFKMLHAQRSADGLAYFNEGMLNELLGNKDAAEAAYKAALKAAGPTPRVVDAYGRFLERNGRADEAKALYKSVESDDAYDSITGPGLKRIADGVIPQPLAPRAEDGAAEALFGIAASLNDDTSRDISILYLRLSLYLEPKLDLATILLANRYEAMGKYDDAIDAYRMIGNDSPFHQITTVAIAVDEARLDHTDIAMSSLEKATQQYPSDIEAWTALGDIYRQAKRFSDAVKAYDHAIEVSSPPSKTTWPLYYARAIAEQQSGNWDKAEADLKKALSLSPNEPAVLNYLGYTWVDQKRHVSRALAMLEKARTLSPQDGYIIDSVGWAYYRLGRYHDAAKALEEAVQLVPGDPTINDHLGDAYWKIGRKLDAKFQWNHALAFGADASEKAKIEKKLHMAQQ